MDNTAQFISDLNVARFVDKLRLQRDPAIQTVLKRLLFEEERKLGFSLEQLGKIDRHLAESRVRISAQKNLIERLRTNGRDTEPAEFLLSNLVGIQEIFERHRQIIVDSLNRNRL